MNVWKYLDAIRQMVDEVRERLELYEQKFGIDDESKRVRAFLEEKEAEYNHMVEFQHMLDRNEKFLNDISRNVEARIAMEERARLN
jgi:rubrerythrin